MPEKRIWITASEEISACPFLPNQNGNDISVLELNEKKYVYYPLSKESQQETQKIKECYLNDDPTVILAITAFDKILKNEGINAFKNKKIAVNIGSARGATTTWEQLHTDFLQNKSVPSFTSPRTTAGSISSKIINHLRRYIVDSEESNWAGLDYSATCNSSAVAIANGYAWLKAGLCDLFIAGGAEMPLTPFTVAQMGALRIYSTLQKYPFCRPFNADQINTFCLGQGAGILMLEVGERSLDSQAVELESIGYAMENPPSLTGISENAKHIQEALTVAIRNLPDDDRKIDLLIAHAPGTVKGDRAEFLAYQEFFRDQLLPPVIVTKHLTGHTFGASTVLNVCKAIDIFSGNYPNLPDYDNYIKPFTPPVNPKRIAVISAGFGGMAICLILKNRI